MSDQVQEEFNSAILALFSDRQAPATNTALRHLRQAATLDTRPCDVWRAMAYVDPDALPMNKLLRALHDRADSFGQLSMQASRLYAAASITPVAKNPISDFLSTDRLVPLEGVIPLSSPSRIAAALAIELTTGDDPQYDEAITVLRSAPVQDSPYAHLATALVHWRAQRWNDVYQAARKLFNAGTFGSDDVTQAVAENGQPYLDLRLICQGYLLAGIAAAHMNMDEDAQRFLQMVTLNQEIPEYPEMRRTAWRTLGLFHRAKGSFAEARDCFLRGMSYGTSDELAADADDESRRINFTSAEMIDARTSYWDQSTEPSLEEASERRRAEAGSEILAEALAKLDEQIALDNVKKKVHEFAANEKMNAFFRSQGIEPDNESRYNFVFVGAPGTGKTVTARSLTQILYGYGVITENKVVEVSAPDLVGSVIGEAEKLTMAKLNEADHGVLFIDEVYQLTQKGDGAGGSNANVFGKKAAEAILKYMEDFPEKCHVIIAGYKAETDSFLDSNPGFKSRFTDTIEFDSYRPDELGQIAELMAASRKPALTLTDEAMTHFVHRCGSLSTPNEDGRQLVDIAGNGRFVRKFIDACRKQLNVRLSSLIGENNQSNLTIADATTITKNDVDAALDPIFTELF